MTTPQPTLSKKDENLKCKDISTTTTTTSPPDQEEEDDDVVTAGANTGKSAEDRKAAAALSSIDKREEDDDSNDASKNQSRHDVDEEAVRRAMEKLGEGVTRESVSRKKLEQKNELLNNKSIKVDASDVALIVDELEISKAKAIDLLKSSAGSVKDALRSYILAAD